MLRNKRTFNEPFSFRAKRKEAKKLSDCTYVHSHVSISPNDAEMGARTKGIRDKSGTNDGVAANKAVLRLPSSSSTSIFYYRARNSPRETRSAQYLHTMFARSIPYTRQISQQRAAIAPSSARTKGSVSLVIRTLGFSPPQRSASGCSANGRPFNRPSRRAPWIYTDTPRTRVCTRSHCQTMAILRADSRTQPLGCRLTFSTRDDGVGLGHGSMVGVNRKLRENGTGNGTVRPTMTVATDFFDINFGGRVEYCFYL